MRGAKLHHELLEQIENELTDAGYLLTPAGRNRMRDAIARIDDVHTPQERAIWSAKLRGELRHISEENASVICEPAVWLGAVECA